MKKATQNPTLASTQRQLWRLLTAPSGVGAALEDEGDREGRTLHNLVRGNAKLSAVLRLEVYANAYFYRILDCLTGDYGALVWAIGETAFHDLVTLYLLVHPPDHPSLRFAGARLPDFLATHRKATPFRRRWPWAADLARLEWALVDAFDAPDAELLSHEDLAALPPEKWQELGLRFHPSAQLLPLGWDVHEVRKPYDGGAHQSSTRAPAPKRAKVSLCVWRRSERVYFRALDALEADLMHLVRCGKTFGDLCQRIAQEDGEQAAPAYAAALLAGWVRDGLLTRRADRH